MARAGAKGRKRADGVESRERILDAATVIAGERGYEGTSIAAVSATCGLPASSIYWHFHDKDDLIGAVIERSFHRWLAALELPDDQAGTPLERVVALAGGMAKSLVDAPDFLRLGLMLAMEHRPDEPRGRAVFLQARQVADQKVREVITSLWPDLDVAAVRTLAIYVIAAGDGLFVQREIGGDDVDLIAMFELHARLVYEFGTRMAAGDRP
jgi:AcrR family transcriptional regulator